MTDLERLSRLLDGDLPEAEAAELRSRIATRPEVAAAWAELRELSAALRPLEEERVPARLVDLVLDAAEAQGAPAEVPVAPRPGAVWRRERAAWGAALIALAALVLAVALPGPRTTLRLEPGTHLVDGHARIDTPAGDVTVDGRSKLEVGEGTVSVSVLSGRARFEGEPGATLQTGHQATWGRPRAAVPAAPASSPPAAPRAESGLDRRIKRLELENSLLRGRLATHEGSPSPWPLDAPVEVREEALTAAFDGAFQGSDGELVGVDCDEYPCLLLVAGKVPVGSEVAWSERLEAIRDGVGPEYQVVHRRFDDVDPEWQYSYGAHAVVPADHPLTGDVRLQYRMEDALLAHWPEWVPQR